MRVICELNESSKVSGANSASCHKQNSLQVATPPYKHASLTLNGTTLSNKTNRSGYSFRAAMKRMQHSVFRQLAWRISMKQRQGHDEYEF